MAKQINETWSGQWTFLFAAVGAAVGLGNIWKFPYIAGENGGAAFVLTYLVCIIVIGIPLLSAELLIGKLKRQDPIASVGELAKDAGRSTLWCIFPFLSMLAGFLILSYYAVISGWTLDYLVQAIRGTFSAKTSVTQVQQLFSDLLSDPVSMIAYQTVIIIVVAVILMMGVRDGIERSVKFMCPFMLIILLILFAFSLKLGNVTAAAHFLFHFDFSKLSGDTVLIALGHAFFSLGIAMGVMMIYGAYMPQNVPVIRAAVVIALSDTFFALLAGMTVFPIVFAHGQINAASGEGLVFETLPVIFSSMPYGFLFSILFFLLLFFAALTSAISSLESMVCWLIRRFQLTRRQAVCLLALLTWLLGIPTVLSFNHWQNLSIFGQNFFEWVDYLTANILMPLTGLVAALFVGYIIRRQALAAHFSQPWLFAIWRFSLRTVTPVAVLLIMLHAFFSS